MANVMLTFVIYHKGVSQPQPICSNRRNFTMILPGYSNVGNHPVGTNKIGLVAWLVSMTIPERSVGIDGTHLQNRPFLQFEITTTSRPSGYYGSRYHRIGSVDEQLGRVKTASTSETGGTFSPLGGEYGSIGMVIV